MKTLLAIGLFLVSAATGGQQPTGPVVAHGNCNGTASGSNITVTVNCDASLSKEQAKVLAKQYAEILRKIQQDKISFDTVIERLDSIQKGVDDLTAATAPRHLSRRQIEALQAQLVGVSQRSIELSYPLNDPEAIGYKKDFQNALSLPDANVEGAMILSPGIGLHLFFDDRYLRAISVNQSEIIGGPPECLALKLFLDAEHIVYTSHAVHDLANGGKPRAPCSFVVGARP